MTKYLDENGLAYFWTKLKAIFAKDDEVLHLTGGTLTGQLDGTDAVFTGDVSADNIAITQDLSVGEDLSVGNDITVAGGIQSTDEVITLQDFITKMSAAEADVVPSSTQYLDGYMFNDKNNVEMGGLQFVDFDSNGYSYNNVSSQGVLLGASKQNPSSQNFVYIGIDDSTHEPIVSLSHPYAWMSELIHTMNYTSNYSDFFTPASGITITEAYAAKWGRYAIVRLVWKKSTNIVVPANGDVSNVVIGSYKTGWIPNCYHPAKGADSNPNSMYMVDAFGSSNPGRIQLTDFASGNARTVAANTLFGLWDVYMLS